MTEYDANPYQKQDGGVPAERRRQNEPASHANENPRDDEGVEYDDDGAVATGMGDDDDGAPTSPWRHETLGFQQPSLWDEAIARIFACKSRNGSL